MKYQKGFTIIELLVVMSTVLALSVTGVLIYTAIHFVAKFW
jgi:prepilin-type N-terminal cleavage/methylation domain-containing protein